MSVGDFDRKTIVINSQFRESGDTNSFTWRFQERVENIRHAELRYFILENGVYNVDSTNDTFYLSEQPAPGGSYVKNLMPVVIPHGYYDDQTFAATIGLCMTASSYGGGGNQLYLVQIDTTGKLVISTSLGSKDFAIGFVSTASPITAVSYPLTASLMGFTFNTNPYAYESVSSGLYLTITSTEATYLANFDYLLVQSQKLGNDISFYAAGSQVVVSGSDAPLRPSATACYAFIPNITATNNVSSLIFNNQRPPQISTLKYPYSLDYVDISLVDKLGALVDTRGNNVSLVIELYTDKQSQSINSNFKNMNVNNCNCNR
jgi:hypothetical protein